MFDESVDEFDWSVRAFVYRHIVDHERPQLAAEAAAAFGIGAPEAQAAYERLHERHALFLDPENRSIRMANPFSGISTPFRVHANGHAYWANCGWDALGIPAAVHTDARISARCGESGEPIELAVDGGRVRGAGEVVHFLVPFCQWYDDLIHT